MNFSAISTSSLIGKLLRLPLRLIPSSTCIKILQGKLKGYKWITGSGNHGYWLGSYEYEKQITFTQHLDKGDIVFDIGANVGFYTLLSSELVGEHGIIFAFEPQPLNIYYLRRHIEINNLKNVTVFDLAISGQEGEMFYDEGPNRYMGHLSKKGKLRVNVTSSLSNMILYRSV